jgi:predicted dienelactone hydrolase
MMCGYRTGVIADPSRPSWTNDGPRPVAWSAWYPTAEPSGTGPPVEGFFQSGGVVHNAALIEGERLPVVLLSHGTGGSAESLGWLARALASRGFVAIGANHHGNTSLEPYQAEGFLCWWERAADLTMLLSFLETADGFAGRLDACRVAAIGFSLGCHTVLSLVGARTSLEAYDRWRSASGDRNQGPKEFPDAGERVPTLLESSAAFRDSWARHGNDYGDARIAALVLIAPPPPIRSFLPGSIRDLRLPVTILSGGADQEAPVSQCADWLVSQNDGFSHHDMGQNVGHYTFLDLPADADLVGRVDIFTDHRDVERSDVHRRSVGRVVDALNASGFGSAS